MLAQAQTHEDDGAPPGAVPSPERRVSATARQRFLPLQLATLVDTAPSDDGWVFEIKYDGYRVEALVDRGQARLLTRRGNDWTARFGGPAARLATLPVHSAILDGEVVALDPAGRSVFELLQQRLDGSSEHDLIFFAFDLLALDGTDLRARPQHERRRKLEQLLRKARATSRGAVRLGQRLEGSGPALLKGACAIGLEGIIAKREDAPYAGKRGRAWLKVKCGLRQEFVVIGFTAPKGSRIGIGSLMLAVRQRGALRYAGRVGSGFSGNTLVALLARLRKLERSSAPIEPRPAGLPAGVRWVKPTLVVEVSFTEWTTDGRLRHPVFQGIREDKPASEVRRERTR
jgi:bifunctional non-homologous end joining protein LigD